MITIFMKTYAPCYLTIYDGVAQLVCGYPESVVDELNSLVPVIPSFRLLESGDFRLLESGDKRLIE